MREKYSNQIARFDSRGAFVEVLNSGFSIGKVQLNFCAYDEKTNAQTKKLPIYIDVAKFLVLANSIANGEFQEKVALGKKDGKFDGKPINDFTSFYVDMGGITEKNLAKKFDEYKKTFPWIQKDKSVSRQMKIQAGQKVEWILRAEYGLGNQNEKGLIVPQGQAAEFVNIPMSGDALRELAVIVTMHYNAYLNQYYSKFSEELFPNQKCNVFKPTTK